MGLSKRGLMKLHKFFILIFVLLTFNLKAQTMDDAKQWYQEGRYAEALPYFQSEYALNPDNATLNLWLGISLFETGSMMESEKHLVFASKKNIPEAFIYLGELYTKMYRFADAEKEFAKYQRTKRRDKAALSKLEEKRTYASQLQRAITRTEDVQIIDSIIVNKSDFLSAYKLSASAGSLHPVSNFLGNRYLNEQTLYQNERKDKIYFSHGDSIFGLALYSMEKLLDTYGNEKKLPQSINQNASQGYPFVMPDGATIYFASTGHGALGGYDLFVTRYNINSGIYLTPNHLNMPFNSPFNDYMLAIDEEKGIGWFASDRFQPKGYVCVYTFIPAGEIKLLETEDEHYLAQRARISSIADTWREGANYDNLLKKATTVSMTEKKQEKEFTFVINDQKTYYKLSDFKNASARELFSKVVNLQNTLNGLERQLSENRNRIAQMGTKNEQLNAQVLSLEKQTESMFKEIEKLKILARNEEIRNSF